MRFSQRLNDAGLEVTRLEVRNAQDIAPAFETLKDHHYFLYVVVDGLIAANRTRILTFATSARLPTIVNSREHAEAGALDVLWTKFPPPVPPRRRVRG